MQLLVKSVLLLLAGLVFFAIAGVVATWAPDKTVAQLKARWAQPPSQFVSIDGLRVHLRDEGPRDDPVPIVLIHGTSDSLHTWDGWAEVLVRQRRVIRFDLPGFGLTGPNHDNDYSDAHYVKFVAAVLDRLGVQRCVLAGNSLGGQVAWQAALDMPQRVRQLVLVDAGGYPLQPTTVPLAFTLARSHVARWMLEYVLPRGLVQAGLRNVYGDPSKVSPELVDRYYDMALRSGNRRALGYRIDVGPAGDAARIKTLALPVLVMWGGRDHLIPLQFGQRFARDITGARLVVFDDLGHLPQQEDALRTVTEFQKFLASQPPN
ncbi:MAG: alpha/beta hydrolase [Rhodoferax sp.]|nr:alpha/beta hydrolase [Rhodoferax sp.]